MSLLIERVVFAPAGRQCSALAYAMFSETNAGARRTQGVINSTVQKRSDNGIGKVRSGSGSRTGGGRFMAGACRSGRGGSAGVAPSFVAGGQVRAAAVQDPDRPLAGHGDP